MEKIIANINDVSWWFTGIFFIVLGIIISKLLLSWLPSLLRRFLNYLPVQVVRMMRWRRKRLKLYLKSLRQHEIYVIWHVCRYWCITTISILLMAANTIFFLYTSGLTVYGSFESKRWLLMLPVYVVMYATLRMRRKLSALMMEHERWKRITRL